MGEIPFPIFGQVMQFKAAFSGLQLNFELSLRHFWGISVSSPAIFIPLGLQFSRNFPLLAF